MIKFYGRRGLWQSDAFWWRIDEYGNTDLWNRTAAHTVHSHHNLVPARTITYSPDLELIPPLNQHVSEGL